MLRKMIYVLLVASLLLVGCTSQPAGPRTLTVITHDSFDISPEVVAAFESQYNAKVTFLSGGDTGTLLNQLILAKGNPPADVLYGLDNTFLSRALDEGILEVYAAPLLAEIPAEFQLDAQNRALPVDYGDVCLNYDLAYFSEQSLAPPVSLADLARPEYRGLLVVQNPATSSPGLAFMLATIGAFGDPGYLDYWNDLVANEVLVVNDWETAYYTEFSRWGGTRPLVVSYSSSPPFEYIYADPPVEAPPVAAVVADNTCFRQIEFSGILAGTEQRELAERWIDFMLSPTFQEDLPLKMAVLPVNPAAQLDAEFAKFLAIPAQPAFVAPALIAEQRAAWLQAWTETVLR